MRYYFETKSEKAIKRLTDRFFYEKKAATSFKIESGWGCVSKKFPEPKYNKETFFDEIKIYDLVKKKNINTYPEPEEKIITGEESKEELRELNEKHGISVVTEEN